MNPFITDRLAALAEICRRRAVRRLAVFGSATGESFDPSRSDVDVVVEFAPLSPTQKIDAYFGLVEDLESLFGVAVDIVDTAAMRNPYFRRSVMQSQVVVYEAA